jgi:tetratricopeptide (TPR) repeat protein
MSLMSLDESRELLLRSARLRARYRYADAMSLVESRLRDVHDDLRENALLELVYAAEEAGDRLKAVEFARRLAELDPDIPTVRRLLAETPTGAGQG